MPFDPLLAVGLFGLYVVLDGLYALYTLAVARNAAVRAATMSAGMYFLMALGVVAYVHNYWYVVPAAAGSWVGTFLAVSRSKTSRVRRAATDAES